MNLIPTDLLFPPLCLHCEKRLTTKELLCPECAPFLCLIDPEERCPYCFSEHEGRGACKECRAKKRWTLPVATLWEKRGAATTLIKHLPHLPYLAKTIASFMALQLTTLSWPLPDTLIPVTSLFTRSPSHTIAKELGLLLNRPVSTRVRRDYADQNLLIVDVELKRERALDKLAERLYGRYPRKIYALTAI